MKYNKSHNPILKAISIRVSVVTNVKKRLRKFIVSKRKE